MPGTRTTAPTETREQEYDRLTTELADIRTAARRGTAKADIRRRHTAIQARLRQILATPPNGYTLPTTAAKLVEHAEAHGWRTSVQWTPPGYNNAPFVVVQVGRRLTEAEAAEYRSDKWVFSLTWHSRDCAPGKLRLFGSGLAYTPDHPAAHDAPSIKAVRAVITAHPASKGSATAEADR